MQLQASTEILRRAGPIGVARVAPNSLGRILILIMCSLGAGFWCQGCHSQAGNKPSIEFDHIPPAGQGGRERVDTFSGRITNARPNQQIVVYAHAGSWWVQPWPEHPLVPIKEDSTWSTKTHLGFE